MKIPWEEIFHAERSFCCRLNIQRNWMGKTGRWNEMQVALFARTTNLLRDYEERDSRNSFNETKWLTKEKKKIKTLRLGKENLTIELDENKIIGENRKKTCKTGNFIAKLSDRIYWPSLTFISLPRVDLLNYFDCFSSEKCTNDG